MRETDALNWGSRNVARIIERHKCSQLTPSEPPNKLSWWLGARRPFATSASPEFTLFLPLFVFRQSLERSPVDPCLKIEVAEAMQRERRVRRAIAHALLS